MKPVIGFSEPGNMGHSIAARLIVHLESKLAGRVSKLQLLFRDNTLVLRGLAPSYYVKQLVQELVMKVSELPLLINEIEVLSPQPSGLGSREWLDDISSRG